MKEELKRIGVQPGISGSTFRISGCKIQPPVSAFQSHNDHRMAMCLAPLALKFGKIEIENPEVIKKSYPEFWDDLRKVGFEISEI
jgi:3-phosphoshikimate 1-carboxyvinyltransferase